MPRSKPEGMALVVCRFDAGFINKSSRNGERLSYLFRGSAWPIRFGLTSPGVIVGVEMGCNCHQVMIMALRRESKNIITIRKSANPTNHPYSMVRRLLGQMRHK